MMWDSFENVAFIRTFENDHIAFLISVDGAGKQSKELKLYVGIKARDGSLDASSFLARNGLAFGSLYYLTGEIPTHMGLRQWGTLAIFPQVPWHPPCRYEPSKSDASCIGKRKAWGIRI